MPLPARWPDFFLIGAGKAGTTSLYRVLAGHPSIFLPEVKEPHTLGDPGTVYGKEPMPRERYLEMFRKAGPDRVAGDCSTSYFISPGSAARIREVRPDARILVILRDPIARAFSDYLMLRRFGVIRGDFLTAVRQELERLERGLLEGPFLVRTSLYAENLGRYLDLLGEERVLVLYTHALREDPAGCYRRVCEFLDIPFEQLPAARLGRRENPYLEERSEGLRRVAHDPRLERLARTLFPAGARALLRKIRERALLRRASKPEMPDGIYPLLGPRLTAELEALGRRLGPEVWRLAERWPGRPEVRAGGTRHAPSGGDG